VSKTYSHPAIPRIKKGLVYSTPQTLPRCQNENAGKKNDINPTQTAPPSGSGGGNSLKNRRARTSDRLSTQTHPPKTFAFAEMEAVSGEVAEVV